MTDAPNREGGNVSRLKGFFEQINANEGKKTEPIKGKQKPNRSDRKIPDETGRAIIAKGAETSSFTPTLRRLGERRKFVETKPSEPKPAEEVQEKGKEKTTQTTAHSSDPIQTPQYRTTISTVNKNVTSRLEFSKDKEDEINALSMKLSGLRTKQIVAKLSLEDKNIDNFNEEVFQLTRKLHHLKKSLNENDPPFLREKIMELEKVLRTYNHDMPKMEDVDKFEEPIKLAEVVDRLLKDEKALDQSLKRFPFTQEELKRDAHLMGLTETQMKEKYCQIANRESLTPAIELHSLSVVTRTEYVTDKSLAEERSDTHEVSIGDRHVVIIPGSQGGTFIKGKFIDYGTYKAVFDLKSYQVATPIKTKRDLIIAQPKTAVEEQVKNTKKFKKEAQLELEANAERELEEAVKKKGSSSMMTAPAGDEEPSTSEIKTEEGDWEYNTTEVKAEEEEREYNTTEIKTEEGDREYNTTEVKAEEEEREYNTTEVKTKGEEKYGTREINPEEESKVGKKEEAKGDLAEILNFKNRKMEEVKFLTDKEKFEKEAAIHIELSSLNLPGIVKVVMMGRTIEGDIFLVQEKAEFHLDSQEKPINSLSQMVSLNSREDSHLSPKNQMDMLEMLADAGDGLAAMHASGFVHKDFKPGNVLCSDLVDEHGKRGLVTDFGTTVATGTKSHALEGSPAFLAPEISAKKEATPKADVWAFGISIWQLTSGFSPDDHPSIYMLRNSEDEAVMTEIGNLYFNKAMKEKYDELYPKPEDKDSFARLTWECTRPDPSERPTMSQVTERLRKISQEAGKKMMSGEIERFSEIYGDFPTGYVT